MCCFCWASKLLSGISEALQLSIGLRNCYLALFQQPFNALKPSQQLCHGTSRGPTNCFCWASKLLSGTSEAPQLSIGLRNCHLACFQHPLKALKPSQQLCHGTSRGPTNCFCWPSKLLSGPCEAPKLSIQLRNCHLARFQHPLKALKPAQQLCHGTSRGAASSGTSEAPQPVSSGLRNCHLARFQHPLKALKPSQQLCHGTSRGPANCFCWASKLLSRPSEAPQLSIGLRNCHLAFSSSPSTP